MYQHSELKDRLIKALKAWSYSKEAATPYNIARRINCSESQVCRILRYLKDEGLVRKSDSGSWHI